MYKDPKQLKALRLAYSKSKANVWKRVKELVERGGRVVNLDRIERNTEDGDKVVVPGKVLSSGTLTHKVIVGDLSFSSAARRKIEEAGGKALTLDEFVRKFKKGKGVKLIG